MSNGARHTWGFFAGVVLTAALAALLIFGSYRLQHGNLTQFHKQDKWAGGGLLIGAAIVFTLLAASRLSPLASLVGGIVFTAAGVIFFIDQKTTVDLINRFPFRPQRVTLAGLEEQGLILFAGVGLLFASLFPSRWRGGDDEIIDSVGYEYGLPESRGGTREMRNPYSGSSSSSGSIGGPVSDPLAGRRSLGDDQPTSQSQYTAQHGSAQRQTSGYETKKQTSLYEPQHKYGSGSTQEMRRNE